MNRNSNRINMGLATGLLLGALGTAQSVQAQPAGFDNPRTDSAPCMVLDRYESVSNRRANRGVAAVQNICGRTLEVQFCFLYVQPVDDVDRQCFSGVVRPGGRTMVDYRQSPAMLAGPAYRWRYIP